MNASEWVGSLSAEDREAIKQLDESELFDYLSERGIELPDEALEQVVGGVNPFAFLYKLVRSLTE